MHAPLATGLHGKVVTLDAFVASAFVADYDAPPPDAVTCFRARKHAEPHRPLLEMSDDSSIFSLDCTWDLSLFGQIRHQHTNSPELRRI